MTIQEFQQKYNLKSEKTIIQWLENGYIPKSTKSDEIWILPNSARIPYTKHRITNKSKTKAIYKSILNACNKRYYISALIYKMSDNEFSSYIKILVIEGLISSYEDDGISFYTTTTRGNDYLKKPFPLNETLTALSIVATTAPLLA